MSITLPAAYQNAAIRTADVTQQMLDLYTVVQQINSGILPRVVQTVVALTGQTIQMTDNSADGTLFLTPAGTLATLTVNFPSDANSILGQMRILATTQNITTLTLANAIFLNMITTINANDCFAFQKVAANTWIFVQ